VIDERELVERAIRALAPENPSFEALMQRRDRKRRNRRIAAGTVGLAIGLGVVLLLELAALRSARESVPMHWPSPTRTASSILHEGEVVELPLNHESLIAVQTATGEKRTIVRCESDCAFISDFAASANGCVRRCDLRRPV
jgi:hypothetical protein